MKYALFLGCVIPAKLLNYEISTRNVFKELGVELEYMNDFICCGFPFESISEETWLRMAAYNLAIASRYNLDIVSMCNGCVNSLIHAKKVLEEDSKKKEEINNFLKENFNIELSNIPNVKHVIHVLYNDIGKEKIREKVKNELKDFRFAVHVGCHIVRPSTYMNFDNPIEPEKLDELVEILGAESVRYTTKYLCCGNYARGINDKVSIELLKRKMEELKNIGVDGLITICPACYLQYEMGQLEIRMKEKISYDIPVIHYTQILGLALGISPKELGFDLNKIKPKKILEKFK